MATNIEMPKLSDTMTEGTLVKWVKQEGDQVAVGDVLAEVETDKATMEMESFDDGILGKIYIQEGEKVAVGALMAVLVEEGEKVPEGSTPEKNAAPEETADKTDKTDGEKKEDKPDDGPKDSTGRIKASPLARKVAAANNVDLADVEPSGPGGRIVLKDVEAAMASGASSKKTPSSAPAPKAVPSLPSTSGEERKISLSGMRKVIASRLFESKTTLPHFYLNIEVDAKPLLDLRAELKENGEPFGLERVTINDLILRATALAAQRVPRVNAAYGPEEITEFGSVNLAVAVAIDDGLITPVIRDAQDKSLREISSSVKDLAGRARNKKLKPDEYQGGTITVSNLGAYGIDSFYAIINPPQAAILAIGAVVKKAVVDANGEIVVGHRMNIGLSADHRVVDGAVGAEFLAALRKLLEAPSMLLV